jgi:hypothetical protein
MYPELFDLLSFACSNVRKFFGAPEYTDPASSRMTPPGTQLELDLRRDADRSARQSRV